jgi:hypothetical protein
MPRAAAEGLRDRPTVETMSRFLGKLDGSCLLYDMGQFVPDHETNCGSVPRASYASS